jgi:hypothetical protein
MSTIAQISATFIAITAGFYTSKIISIANEKTRISGRIREINTELSVTRVNQENLQTQIDSINDADAADNIKKFKNDLLTDELLRSYKITTFNDLISVFEKFYERKPLPIEEKYLRAQSTEIIQEVMVEQKSKNKREEKLCQDIQVFLIAYWITPILSLLYLLRVVAMFH